MRAITTFLSSLLLAIAPALNAQTPATAPPRVDGAVDGVLALFHQKSVVVLCDEHGVAQEEDFYSALVKDPRFAEKVGNLIVEFGGEAWQGTIDRYVAGEDVPMTELRHVWTETPGWVPGPTRIGYVNVFAAVRATNLRLPPEKRIKVWLGEPKIDWSKINSFPELQPFLGQRDDNYVRIIRDDVLAKKKKAVLIIGTGHIFGPAPLIKKLAEANLELPATVVPFTGYVEPVCNNEFVARARNWPTPATVAPAAGTSLKALLMSPDCNFVSAEEMAQIKATPPDKLPPGISSAEEMARRYAAMASGEDADAVLYLGAPESLTQSLYDPAIYLDSVYFKEQARRMSCCTSPKFRRDLTLEKLLELNAVSPHKLSK